MARKEGSRSILRASRNTTTGGRATRRGPGALRRACEAVVTPRSGFEPLEQRLMMARDPVMLFQFNEAATATTVTDSAAAGGVTTGTLVADGPEGEAVAPEIRTEDPSPAGGNYVHFEGSGIFSADLANPSVGGRVELSELLNPILGDTSSLSFYIRTTQTGMADAWQSPGVTGAEQAGGGSDVFWGNLDANGDARIVAGNGAGAASGPIADGTWYHITQTRNATTGLVKTYVNGVLASQATGETGVKGANFKSLGATTNVAADLTTVQGYTHLNGDLDQVEVFNRELNPAEIIQFYGAPAAAVPATPGPVTATANSPTQVTLTFTDVTDEAGYIVRRAAAAGGPFTDVGFVGPDQTSFIDRGLTQGTQYFYQVTAFNQAGESAIGAANVTTPSPGLDPVIVYNFNEGGGTTVEDVSSENVDNDGTLAGDTPPEFLTENPSPAGGSYLHFSGDGVYQGTGGRVDTDELLNPILGNTGSISYYLRTTQTGNGTSWESPGVTGAEQAGGGSDIFWGNLTPEGGARVVADDGAQAASNPINTGEWFRVTHTRDKTTGMLRTYVNGNFVSEAVGTIGEMLANFRAIGATTDVAGDLTTIQGYNYLGGDLDQLEIFDRELTPQEVARRYGAAATAVPASPTPVTATTTPTTVTLNFANVANEAGYQVLRSTSATGPFTLIGTVAPDSTSFIDQGLTFETPYFYQVIPYNAFGTGTAATGNATTTFPARDPVVVYNFEDAADGTTVDNSGTAGDAYDATLAGDQVPVFQTTNASPAGGAYMHFAVIAPGGGTPTFQNQGGRIDAASLLSDFLGGTGSLSYYIRTTQTGHADAWQSPGVTGAEQAGGGDDIFWGNLDPAGQARIVAGNGAASASTPVNTGDWVRVTHTRNAASGVVRTYVNGALVSEATSETGVKGANFYSIGATTDVAADLTTVQGYNYLDGDLDQVEIFDRELTPVEIGRFFGSTAPVQVAQVFVNGQGITGQTSANGIAFRNLAGVDNTFGYPVPAGANQTKSIPWSGGINKISVRFTQDVASQLQQGDLVVHGINTANYEVSGFTYDAATKTGTWTLTTPIVNDKVSLILDDANVGGLDGEWANGADAYPSGNAAPGGDFSFRLNVLRGDANQDGAVNALDLGQLKSKLNRTATNPGSGTTGYSVFADLNADGQINALDLGIAKARLNTRLPAGEPAVTALLFSTTAISR